MQKIKPLLPSLREDKRYLVIEIVSDSLVAFGFDEINKQLVYCFEKYLGLFGVSEANISILKETFDKKSQRVIISASRRSIDKIKACLVYFDEINKKKAMARSVYCSGTIKKAKEMMKLRACP
jgi:RNase P/RNase MRP subunit POP5